MAIKRPPQKILTLKQLIVKTILDASDIFKKDYESPHVMGCTIVQNIEHYAQEHPMAESKDIRLAVREELDNMVSAGKLTYDFCADHNCYGLANPHHSI